MLVTGFGLSPQTYGWVVALNGVGLVGTNWLNRRLLGRFGYDAILRKANLGSLISSGLLLVDAVTGFGGLWGITVPLFVMVGMVGFTQPNAIAGALARDPQRAGTISALVGFMQFGGGAVGAAVAGAWTGAGGLGQAAVPMAAVIFIAYGLAATVLRSLGRKD